MTDANESQEGSNAVLELAGLLSDDNVAVAERAAQQLRDMGPAAEAAIPALVQALHDRNGVMRPLLREIAADVLGKMGKAATPYAITLLKHPDDRLRATAASILGELGQDANEAFSLLFETAKDPDPSVRAGAPWVLLGIAPTNKEVLSVVTEMLFDEDPYVRNKTVIALYANRRVPPEHIPFAELERLLQDEENGVLPHDTGVTRAEDVIDTVKEALCLKPQP